MPVAAREVSRASSALTVVATTAVVVEDPSGAAAWMANSRPICISRRRAAQSWTEARDWDGRNNVGRSSGSQWRHQTLYRSRKGRYYLAHESNVQGEGARAEFVTPEEAAAWLLLNEHKLPEDLAAAGEAVSE